jgi:hypothetical protein
MNRLTQSRLLKMAAGFLVLQTLLITLSPAVRERSLEVEFRWSQWVALILWGLFMVRAHRSITRRLPDADPYILLGFTNSLAARFGFWCAASALAGCQHIRLLVRSAASHNIKLSPQI